MVTARRTWKSHAYVTMPPAPSRARSRRRSSSAVRASRLLPSVRGSRTRRSVWVAVSKTHNALTLSTPEPDRAKTTRAPSGDTVKFRGSPRVRRWVRAYWRGKVSLTRAGYLMHLGEHVCPPIRCHTCPDPHPCRGYRPMRVGHHREDTRRWNARDCHRDRASRNTPRR